MITIELTVEEAEILKQILNSAPLTGNVRVLTSALANIVSILRKLEVQPPKE